MEEKDKLISKGIHLAFNVEDRVTLKPILTKQKFKKKKTFICATFDEINKSKSEEGSNEEKYPLFAS